VLAVEGTHDAAFFEAFLRSLAPEGPVPLAVRPIGGKTQLPTRLRELAEDPSFRPAADSHEPVALGIARDADEDAARAFQSVADALHHAGFPVPELAETVVVGDLVRDGEVLVPGVAVSVFIMPGQGRPGALEDLCLEAIGGDPRRECVERLFACLEEKGISGPPDHRLGKARAHAFLATHEFPDVHVGTGAEKRYWPLDSPVFSGLKDFLRRLAAPEP
jgi:hypothetical protein